MTLKFEVDSIEEVPEVLRAEYEPHDGKLRLKVDGIDPADELKKALKAERDEKKTVKDKLKELQDMAQEAEKKRLEANKEYEKLYRNSEQQKLEFETKFNTLNQQIVDQARSEIAQKVAGSLTKDTTRAKLINKEAMTFIVHTPEGIKITGPGGLDWDEKKLSDHITKEYPFLVDGSGATGGGATGGNPGGSGVAIMEQLNKLPPVERIAAARAAGITK